MYNETSLRSKNKVVFTLTIQYDIVFSCQFNNRGYFSIIVPSVTIIRFFPTIAEDYRQIKNAMAFRGIASGKLALLRNPAQSLEYILMPLLMNSNNVAQDLSVAAMTKGISMPGIHTSMTELRMTAADGCCMLAGVMPFALYFGGVL